MKKNTIKTLSVLYLLAFLLSCDRPVCKNTNPIFDKYTPDTKEYKNELGKQLAKVDTSQLSYWMDKYQEKNKAPYLWVYIQGDGLCAEVVLKVNDSHKGIEGILENKGKGYGGAELKNLKFDIKQDSIKTEFSFKEISGIVD
ncbi:hypothetical protein [Flavobacterium sp. N1994]|uniref:hypothetical protein n=1 Tax=Flavobacterium sp. N1994 TaxID=2986827 RepID=UPI002221D5C8|nr:hypothetical protein [Flavobacterium sp. N1994]